MRHTLVMLAAALLSIGALACGTREMTSSRTTASSSYLKKDGDEDRDDEKGGYASSNGEDRALLTTYGPVASAANARAVTNVVKRYYAVSAAGDGAAACSLLYPSLAEGLAGGPGQVVRGAGNTCAGAMSLLLLAQHNQFVAEDVATMVVTSVHVKGNSGLAILGFKRAQESEIILERAGHTWKIDALFGGIMP